jgi:acyl dehydratase
MGEAAHDRGSGGRGVGLTLPLDPQKLLALKVPHVEHVYSEKDAILYALGVGLGHDSTDPKQLGFVYEQNLKVLPTFAVVLGLSPYLLRDADAGIDFAQLVHGEESVTFHRALAPAGRVVARTRIVDVVDKGAGRGALIMIERAIVDKATDKNVATLIHTIFCRGDGGFGGAKRDMPAPHAIPGRASDAVCDLPTRPETALIYRLSGDTNPLHADPEFARAAGFERPILHGLATFGIACHALLRTVCDYDPSRLKAMAGRFSAPVFPGETIRTEVWRDGNVVSFRARVLERDVIAINNGRAEVT